MEQNIILFKSKSCHSCEQVLPLVSAVTENYKEKVLFQVIDITENTDLAIEYGVLSVPTIVFVREGKEIKRLTGFVSRDKIEQAVKLLVGDK